MANTDLIIQVVPHGQEDQLVFNMKKILLAETRAEEIAALTPQKAPELLAVLNRGYLDAANIFAKCKLEQSRAEDEVAKIKATVLIDKAPTLMKEKGLSSSADIRQALVDSDPEYQIAKERLSFLDATVEYVKGKMKFLENSYSSVKKIMDTGNWNMILSADRKTLDGILDEDAPIGGFGQPK